MPAQLVLAKDLLPGSHTLIVSSPHVTGEDRELFDNGTDVFYEDYTLVI